MKSDLTTQYIKTLDYGYLAIRYDNAYVYDEVVDIIEEADSENFYKVVSNLNGKLVAILIKGGL